MPPTTSLASNMVDLHAVEGQESRGREPCRARADDRDSAASRRRSARDRPRVAGLPRSTATRFSARIATDLVVVVAGAAGLAQVRADIAGHAGQWVAGQDHLERPVVLALGDQPGILGHVLLDRARFDARRDHAVPKAQSRLHLRQAEPGIVLLVARIDQRLGRSPLDVGQPVGCQLGQAGRAARCICASRFSSHWPKAGIAARLEQVRAGRDRRGAAGQDRGDVECVGAGRVRNAQVAGELVHQGGQTGSW